MPSADEVAGRSVRAAVRAALDLIGPAARRRYIWVLVAQTLTALLDLAGVLLVGITVVLVYAIPTGAELPAAVTTVVDQFGLQDVSITTLAVTAAGLAAVLLLAKSAITALITYRAFRFLAARQSEVSTQLARRWFGFEAMVVQSRTDIRIDDSVSMSVYYATTGILGPAAVALAEASLLVVLSAMLLVVDPVAAILAGATFGIVALGVHRVLGRWAQRLGRQTYDRAMSGRAVLRHSVESFRELRVAQRVGFALDQYTADLSVAARGRADLLFVNNVPKFSYEAAMVVGAVVIVGWRSAQGDLTAALGLLAVFLTAAARLLPSMVRLQGQLVTMANAVPQAEAAFELARSFDAAGPAPTPQELGRAVPAMSYPGFVPSIAITDLTVFYPEADEPAVTQVSLAVEAGTSLVLAGPTGAGKSTLVDAVLGMLEPTSGSVLIGGLPPREAQRRWPGAIAYMPQESVLWDATVRANVALGLPRDDVDDAEVWRALEQAHVADEVRARGGLDLLVGPHGRAFSGGQRQRIGIARTLYSRPMLVVLDEATSALDEPTEALIGRVLDDLRGQVTVVAVAHRRSTIERATRVANLLEGRLVHLGPPTH